MKKSILNLTGKDGQIICASGIIDQRDDDSDTFGSERQLERVHEKKIRRAVRDAFNDKSIEDILNREDIEVVVEKDQDELDQAVIHHGQGGEHDQVLPGNDRFKQYDKIDGSGGGQGQGEPGDGDPGDGDPGDGEASDSGEGKDSFRFNVSKDEYLDYLFQDLELPNQAQVEFSNIFDLQLKRSGYSNDGKRENLDAVKTMRKNIARGVAFDVPLTELVLDLLVKTYKTMQSFLDKDDRYERFKEAACLVLAAIEQQYMAQFTKRILKLKRQQPTFVEIEKAIDICAQALNAKRLTQKRAGETLKQVEDYQSQFTKTLHVKRMQTTVNVNTDGRFRNFSYKPTPQTRAVMFCLMDVSGSMSQSRKDIAKRFYILLYLFLKMRYESVEIVYISYHTVAKRVEEEEFFYGQETGGTIASSGLKLMNEIQKAEYPASEWNVYAAQASDGDNYREDSATCRDIVDEMLNSTVRYFVYMEIEAPNPQHLWRHYEALSSENDLLFMGRITKVSEIYPTFRDAFTPRNVEEA